MIEWHLFLFDNVKVRQYIDKQKEKLLAPSKDFELAMPSSKSNMAEVRTWPWFEHGRGSIPAELLSECLWLGMFVGTHFYVELLGLIKSSICLRRGKVELVGD